VEEVLIALKKAKQTGWNIEGDDNIIHFLMVGLDFTAEEAFEARINLFGCKGVAKRDAVKGRKVALPVP
jgi:hypothetical protein